MKRTEEQLVAQIDPERLMAATRQLAEWVRLSGTPEELAAFRWVEGELKAAGLQTELLLHDAYISLPGPATLYVEGIGEIAVITHAMAVSREGRGEIVFGEAADATGKILLVEGLATPAAVLAAQSRGAQALLVINDENHHEMIVSPVWGSPTLQELDRLPQIAVMSIRRPDGERIKAALAREVITARYQTRVETGWRKTPLLVAEVPGPGPEYVMLSGHLDSWHLGAMDNGSANAAMMEVARLINTVRDQLKRGLKVIFWSGHSHGRYSGSAWYADTHWAEIYAHCIAHVNVDSLGGQGATIVSEGLVSPELHGLGAAVVRQYTRSEYAGRRVNRSSDQSFIGIGVPSLWGAFSEQPAAADAIGATGLFGGKAGGLGWWWHTVHDTVDKVDPALLERDCQCYVAAVSRLVLAERLPLDPEASAASFLAHLKEYAERAGSRFDLSRAVALAEELVGLTARLKRPSIPPGRFNEAVRLLSRQLIPVEQTEAGLFEHDPALAVPPIPALRWIERLVATVPDSDEERFVRPLVTRGQNRVLHALSEAIRVVEHHLA